ncbi:acetyltransferase, CysE/LacA/LpxA/NodL family [Aspergillus rambellii]|uniref:Acetyltransferase, CysE/LacA/LpxA/NodL family n=1 Tax=Aspergillus rambellii TaxID=308745 RepID=A0A0F8WKC9_9EURO|nr:acetyltransferase, CysE/LacA/LpxA/NodL family [Aspergillus rambellii]
MAGTEKEKMLRGELYCAFTPDLLAERTRCKHACNRFNNAGEVSRRRLLELWKDIVQDTTPLPPAKEDPVEDEEVLKREPWIEPPIRMDYGYNVKVGAGAFINFDCVILDTCLVTIGARTLLGPKVALYSGTHPLDPAIRNGTSGPESGKEIHIGEDCWLAGNVIVLPGVTIGDGAVIGAGSVVTKDVPAYHLAVGNPAKIVRKIDTTQAA